MKKNKSDRVIRTFAMAVMAVLVLVLFAGVSGIVAMAAEQTGANVGTDTLGGPPSTIAPTPDAVGDVVSGVVGKFPWLSSVLLVVGACRLLINVQLDDALRRVQAQAGGDPGGQGGALPPQGIELHDAQRRVPGATRPDAGTHARPVGPGEVSP